MEVMSQDAHGTPPNQPTYNVRLSAEKVQAIFQLIFPDHLVVSCQQLASGKSFNNRIYLVNIKRGTDSSDSDGGNFVLKVSGHYFGARKVQNEVCSLLLLQKYCTTVPTPLVIAWSEDGKIIQTARGDIIDTTQSRHGEHQSVGGTDGVSAHSWVLMTRLAGRTLSRADLEGPYGGSLVKEAARYMASWRASMPQVSGMGNCRFRQPSDAGNPDATVEVQDTQAARYINVGGLLLCHQYSPAPLPTPLSYYAYLARDQYFQLCRTTVMKALHNEIAVDVRQFLDDVLPRLPCFQQATKRLSDPPETVPSHRPAPSPIKFTHLDFAPRNILVSDGPESGAEALHITGILDFEFAGFLPNEEEFVNMTVRQPDDWSVEHYDLLIKELASLGCEAPHLPDCHSYPVCTKQSHRRCSCDDGAFDVLSRLVKVIDNIAPWFIQEGSHTLPELAQETEKAAEIVRRGIQDLKKLVI